MSNNVLDTLERLIEESAKKRMNFLLAITKSSRSISDGAIAWFDSEVVLLKEEMKILESIMPEDVQEWQKRLSTISTRFQRAISYLNKIIDKAEKGEVITMPEVYAPRESTSFRIPPPSTPEEKEEEKKLDLVSAILEVFDSAADLEKLINEVEREIKRTIHTAKLAMKAMQKEPT